MTIAEQQAPLLTWTEPDGIAVRGTLVVIPGRGEQPAHYERFGRRISADGYRVHAVTDPTADAELTASQVTDQLAGHGRPGSWSDPTPAPCSRPGWPPRARSPGSMRSCWPGCRPHTPACRRPGRSGRPGGRLVGRGARHPDRMPHPPRAPVGSGPAPRRAVRAHPRGWTERADLGAVTVPVLGLHGTDDPVSPLAAARARYATAASAELVSIIGGRHDALNDLTHRTVAATVVIFLERLRLGPGLPRIAVSETPEVDWAMVLP